MRSRLPSKTVSGWTISSSRCCQSCRLRARDYRNVDLLQAQLFSSGQQLDRFTNTPGARFRSFGGMNPDNEITPVGGRQLLEKLPPAGIRLERFGDVARQDRDDWSWRVGIARGRGRQAGRRQLACRFEFRPSLPIDVRPFARL